MFMGKDKEFHVVWTKIHSQRQRLVVSLLMHPHTLDFGPVSETSRPTLTATLTNNGDAPVNITDIVRTCVCADMAVSPTNIPPGGTATITATLDPNVFSGPFLKTFYLRTDDPDTPSIAVPLRGTVVPLWTVEPSKWTHLRPGETNAAFRIHPATNAPPLVRAEAVGATGATASLVPLPDGDWEAMLAFDPADLAPGHHDWTLNLHPEDPALRPLSLHVGASVGERWTCSPPRLLAPSDGSSYVVDLLLRPTDMAAVPTDIDPAAIALSPSWDRVAITPAGPASALGIPLRLTVGGDQLRSWQSPKVFHLTIPGHGTASVYLETALSASSPGTVNP